MVLFDHPRVRSTVEKGYESFTFNWGLGLVFFPLRGPWTVTPLGRTTTVTTIRPEVSRTSVRGGDCRDTTNTGPVSSVWSVSGGRVVVSGVTEPSVRGGRFPTRVTLSAVV